MHSTEEKQFNRSLATSVGRSTVFGVVATAVQVLTRLVTVPVIISHLGLGGYGIWNVVMVTATYMRFGSVGIKTAFQKYVAEATGNGDYERANRLLSTGSAVMTALSVAGLVPAAIFSQTIARASGVPPEFIRSAATSISILAVIMLTSNVAAAFEAIVMGGHRIDLLRKLNTFFSVAEAIAIVAVLHLGFGLAAMAAVMGASELMYLVCCYVASKKIVPQIQVGLQWLSKGVLWELSRFAGSYQIVNVLEVIYNSLIPVAILRNFGPSISGAFAVVTRIVGTATALHDSFLAPALSAGATVFASGSADNIRSLLAKVIKVSMALSLFPLGYIAVFGPTLAFAWTGQRDPSFGIAFWLISARGLFAALSSLALVLYRMTGKALLDNIRQVGRVVLIFAIFNFASRLGFQGVLVGLLLCELLGMLFMFLVLSKTFDVFTPTLVLPGMLRMFATALLVFTVGIAVSYIPLPGYEPTQAFATVKLFAAALGCMIVTWPFLLLTRSVTATEKQILFSSLLPGFSRQLR